MNRGTPSTVDFTQELGAWDHAIASTRLSYTPAFSGDVTRHQNSYALLLDRVQEDVRYWLTRQRCDRRPVILNREEQTKVEEPAEDRSTVTPIALMIPIGPEMAAL